MSWYPKSLGSSLWVSFVRTKNLIAFLIILVAAEQSRFRSWLIRQGNIKVVETRKPLTAFSPWWLCQVPGDTFCMPGWATKQERASHDQKQMYSFLKDEVNTSKSINYLKFPSDHSQMICMLIKMDSTALIQSGGKFSIYKSPGWRSFHLQL